MYKLYRPRRPISDAFLADTTIVELYIYICDFAVFCALRHQLGIA